jgi:hypothetical protein
MGEGSLNDSSINVGNKSSRTNRKIGSDLSGIGGSGDKGGSRRFR